MMLKLSEDFRRGGDEILVKCCDGVELFHKLMKDTETNSAEMSMLLSDDFDLISSNPYKYLGNFFKFIHVTYIEKFKELSGDFIESINSKRYLTTALCGRSIIESTAALRYYNNAVMKKVKVSSGRELDGIDAEFLRDVFDLTNKHMRGSSMNWGGFFTADKKTFVRELVKKEKRRLKKEAPVKYDFVKSIAVGKFLDSWFDDEPELVALAYNFFSELVHPNLGSNLLLIGTADGKVQVGRDSNRAAGKAVCREAVKFINPCLKEATFQLSQSLMFSWLGNEINNQPQSPMH